MRFCYHCRFFSEGKSGLQVAHIRTDVDDDARDTEFRFDGVEDGLDVLRLRQIGLDGKVVGALGGFSASRCNGYFVAGRGELLRDAVANVGTGP